MTIDELTKVFKMLNGMYRHANLGKDNLAGYHLMLADVPYETVMAGMRSLLEQNPDFVPSAPAMRNHFLGTAEDEYSAQLPNGEQAWEEIHAEIKRAGWNNKPRFSHPLIERTMRAFGWQEICGCQLDQLNTLRSQVERFHNQFRADALAALKRGTPMHVAITSWADQKRIDGLVPVALPVGDDVEDVA